MALTFKIASPFVPLLVIAPEFLMAIAPGVDSPLFGKSCFKLISIDCNLFKTLYTTLITVLFLQLLNIESLLILFLCFL